MSIKQRLIKRCAAAQNQVYDMFEANLSPAEIADRLVGMLDLDDIMIEVCMFVYDDAKLDEILNLFDVKLDVDADNDCYVVTRLDGTEPRRMSNDSLWWQQLRNYARNLTAENVVKALTIAIPAVEDKDGFIEELAALTAHDDEVAAGRHRGVRRVAADMTFDEVDHMANDDLMAYAALVKPLSELTQNAVYSVMYDDVDVAKKLLAVLGLKLYTMYDETDVNEAKRSVAKHDKFFLNDVDPDNPDYLDEEHLDEYFHDNYERDVDYVVEDVDTHEFGVIEYTHSGTAADGWAMIDQRAARATSAQAKKAMQIALDSSEREEFINMLFD